MPIAHSRVLYVVWLVCLRMLLNLEASFYCSLGNILVPPCFTSARYVGSTFAQNWLRQGFLKQNTIPHLISSAFFKILNME